MHIDNILQNSSEEGAVKLRLKQSFDCQVNNNQDSYHVCHPTASFRWSEQLNHHGTVAKLRTAITCHGQDLREMEFLLPQQQQQSQPQSSPQLIISRHSQKSVKSAKLRDQHDEDQRQDIDENSSTNGQQQQLSIHRLPVQLRNKIAGNTPHPRVSKMSKKQVKLAQAQLDKLTQSNLHLHGKHISARLALCTPN